MSSIGSAMGGILLFASPSSDDPLNRACEQFLQEFMKQKSPMADNIVNAMITRVNDKSQSNFGPDLKGLSASILIEMKLILQNGDDAALNAPSLSSVNQAYDVAKTR